MTNLIRSKEESFFRSHTMTYLRLYVPFEQLRHIVCEIGEMGVLELVDPIDNLFLKGCNPQLKTDTYRKDKISLKKTLNNLKILKKVSKDYNINIEKKETIPLPLFMNNEEEVINEKFEKLNKLLSANEKLEIEKDKITQHLEALCHSAEFLDVKDHTLHLEHIRRLSTSNNATIMENGLSSLNCLIGTIKAQKIFGLEKMVFRSTLGNILFKYNIKENMPNSTFVCFVIGTELKEKIIKIAKSMDATIYTNISKEKQERNKLKKDLEIKEKELSTIIENTNTEIINYLKETSEHLDSWCVLLEKQLKVYEVMNMFTSQNSKFLMAEGWCPSTKIQDLKDKLGILSSQSKENHQKTDNHNNSILLTILGTNKTPPTYIQTNKFTQGFQNIVNAYGLPSYKEVNPALFTIVTFPFMFAIMFGDIGHGFIMLLFAIFIIMKENKLTTGKNEMLGMLINGRYLILLMALFSMFTGLIYNDMFSLSLPIFRSGWIWTKSNTKMDAYPIKGYSYPVGIDPVWHGADNNLIFTNSLKMKMSVIVGVVHMVLGIILGMFNHTENKKKFNIFLQTIPQLLFMLSIFGYLCFCIVLKWSINWFEKIDGHNIHNSPPGLLNMLIYMFLKPGTVKEEELLFKGQPLTQLVLLLVAMTCVPIMLLGSPIYLKMENSKSNRKPSSLPSLPVNTATHNTYQSSDLMLNTEASQPQPKENIILNNEEEEEEQEKFDFGELMIHQTIHTIEFCLGCISNTASYLRLWALSLAHAQLSIVLFDMTIKMALNRSTTTMKIIFMIVAIPVWLILTIGILIVMEGLSAFLHALRLHWVEFNNKFYMGNGKEFKPFNLKNIKVENDNEE